MKLSNLPFLVVILASILPLSRYSYAQNVDTSMIVVQASNPNIVYTGRIDFSSKNDPAFSYSGVSIKLMFTGDAIDMLLQDLAEGDEQHTNYLNVIVDDEEPQVVKLNKHQRIYFLARNLDLREHTLEIIKRTESSIGGVVLHGFRLRRGNKIMPLTDVPQRKIEFIGNSLTTGYGNEVSIAPPPQGNPNTGFHSVNENNYTAWGAVTARALKARYHCTAYSGRGLYRNNTGSTNGTLPLIYDFITPEKTNVVWDHQKFIPDVIVIDLGANDFATGVPDSSEFCSTYLSFIEKLKTIHPLSKIVCVAGNSLTDTWPAGENRWTKMRNYLNSIVKKATEKGDTTVYYFELTPQTAPYGEDWHPTNATHKKMADAIVPFIKSITSWQ
ncbi:MAG TPA: SGNH/GDSL hydrolase family protein [Cytophagaceae bacterium]|jgi:lysophospholipase L1-like esterase|nr:SGNH/GDSL hydrolase family protein [Cytophagaceae bacterium]